MCCLSEELVATREAFGGLCRGREVKLRTNPVIDVPTCFKTIFNTLKAEDKILTVRTSLFEGVRKIYGLKDVEGIFNLDEKHIQYIVYKALLGMIGDYRVYMEDPYPYKERGKKCCDITIYTSDWRGAVWIEIKTTGWCSPGKYKEWTRADAQKLRHSKKGASKYLLVTSIEDGEQDGTEWNKWFRNFKGVKFDANLFGSFFSHEFKDGNKTVKGYYTVCLLKVISHKTKGRIEWLSH